jgi:hypothetical protein
VTLASHRLNPLHDIETVHIDVVAFSTAVLHLECHISRITWQTGSLMEEMISR